MQSCFRIAVQSTEPAPYDMKFYGDPAILLNSINSDVVPQHAILWRLLVALPCPCAKGRAAQGQDGRVRTEPVGINEGLRSLEF